MKQKVALVQKVSGKKVGMHLDVGSGTGAFVHAMTEEGWLSTGVEPDEQAREIAAKRYKADVFPAEHFLACPQVLMMLLHYGMYWSMYTGWMNI